MFRYVIMISILHVHDVFEKISVMPRPGKVKLLSKFCMEGFVFVSFIFVESFIKFWAVVWRLALKNWLKYRVASTKLSEKDYNHSLVGLCM